MKLILKFRILHFVETTIVFLLKCYVIFTVVTMVFQAEKIHDVILRFTAYRKVFFYASRSKSSISKLRNPEAVTRLCSVKKLFLIILQNLQENTCDGASFLKKLQASALQYHSKRGSGGGVFWSILRIF